VAWKYLKRILLVETERDVDQGVNAGASADADGTRSNKSNRDHKTKEEEEEGVTRIRDAMRNWLWINMLRGAVMDLPAWVTAFVAAIVTVTEIATAAGRC
jgi:hypothetical protein